MGAVPHSPSRAVMEELIRVISGTPSSKRRSVLAVLVACAALLQPGAMPAAPVAVRHTEGSLHGFLVLRTLAGDTLADGDLVQVASGDRVTIRLVFRFKDGSVHDDTAVLFLIAVPSSLLPKSGFTNWKTTFRQARSLKSVRAAVSDLDNDCSLL